MIVLPQLYMFDFSFRYNLPPPEIGGANDVYTLKNYEYLIFGREGSDEMLNWLHLEVFFKTIVASVIVTMINFLLCYRLRGFGYALRFPGRQRGALYRSDVCLRAVDDLPAV